MFLLIPAVLAGYCMLFRNRKIIPALFIGLMSGILLCVFKTFFLYAHRIIPYSLSSNIVYLLIRQTLLPVLIVYAIFLVFSRDTLEYRGEALCPLLLSFYLVYLPYSIVTTSEGLYSGFAIFIKPILFAFMILTVSFCAKKIFKAIEEKKYIFMILFILLALVYLILPAVIESFSIINEKILVRILVSLLYCFIPIGIQVLLFLKKK